MRQFKTVSTSSTVGQWVDAFNDNALASSDHTWYLGEMLYNGLLYTGLETVGGQSVKALTNLNLSSVSPANLTFDNMYIYFRDVNKILLVEGITFDLSDYNTGEPMFMYINSSYGYRVSQKFDQKNDELAILRFIISTTGVFTQCYVVPQRFGSNVYNVVQEFYGVEGCIPKPIGNNLSVTLSKGTIKRSGIKFDDRLSPDVLEVVERTSAYDIRYITADNKINYASQKQKTFISDKYLNYTLGTLSDVPTGKYSVQRILYDVYDDCLVVQYGNAVYDDLDTALSSTMSLAYPVPYDEKLYIPLAILVIESGITDFSDTDKFLILQQLESSQESTSSLVFATDAYARGRIIVFQDQLNALSSSVASTNTSITNHTTNKNNPHTVTKDQLGLGKVTNMSRSEYETEFDRRYLRKTGNEQKSNNLLVVGELGTSQKYISVGGTRLYIGRPSSGQKTGDFLLE